MPNEKDRLSPSSGNPLLRLLLLGALMALAIVIVALLLVARDDTVATTSPSASSGQTSSAATTTTILDTEAEVTARLREILEIREKAFAERDASLFEDVYTSDCS